MSELYCPGDTFFHRLAPQTKIIFTFLMSVAALFIQMPIWNLVFLLAVGIPVIWLKFKIKITAKVLGPFIRTAIVVTLAIMISWLLFSGVGTPIIQVYDGIYITDLSIPLAIAMALRLLSLLSITIILVVTTKERDLIAGMRKLHIPYFICLIFALAIRFIPTLYDDYQTIIEAQMSRGLELEKGKFIERIKKQVIILIPWIATSFKRVSTLANALDSRGFVPLQPRSFYREPGYSAIDYAFIALCVVVFVLICILRFYFGYLAIIPWRL